MLLNSHIFLLVSSVIFPIALLILPGIRNLLIFDEGMVKLRSNVSDSSTILSTVTGILIFVLVLPAVKVAVIGVEV